MREEGGSAGSVGRCVGPWRRSRRGGGRRRGLCVPGGVSVLVVVVAVMGGWGMGGVRADLVRGRRTR